MSDRLRAFIGVVILGFALGEVRSGLADDFFDRIMQVLGISATPRQMRGESDTSAGQIWVADLERGTPTALTTESDYRWPVYEPSGQAVVALRGNNLVRVLASNGTVTVLHKIAGVEKLVGFDRTDPDKLLVVLDKETTPLAFLSLKTANLTPLPYDSRSEHHRQIFSHVKGQERVYGIARVYVKTESKRSMEGELQWDDVYLQRDNAAPRNVSNSDGFNCGQPSLSPDGKSIVYIRASGAG